MFISEHKGIPKLFLVVLITPPFNRIMFEGTLKDCNRYCNENKNIS